MNFDSQERAIHKVSSIIKTEGYTLDDVDHALEAAMQRKGSFVTEQMRIVGHEATDRLLTNAPLTAEDKAVLEGIVYPNGLRPAIDIEKDSFDPLTSMWEDINNVRLAMTPLISAVGRINILGHPKISYGGTAFVCGADLLLTNRHVAEEFMAADSESALLEFKLGMSAMVDTKEEVDSAETRILKLTGEGAISKEWDVAILRVEGLAQGMTPMPLASSAPSSLKGRTAVTIGYPAFDEAENLIQQMMIFRSVFNKKRLLPGKFNEPFPVLSYGTTVHALVHDCTTLGGSSGSAVVDIESLKVFGVHFAGESGIRNYCVPTWRLVELPSFAGFREQMSFQ